MLGLDPCGQCRPELLGGLACLLMAGYAIGGYHHRAEVTQIHIASLGQSCLGPVLPFGQAGVGGELFGHIDHWASSHSRNALGLGSLALDLEGLAHQRHPAAQDEFGQRTLLGWQLVDQCLPVATASAQTLCSGLGRLAGTLAATIATIGIRTLRRSTVGSAAVATSVATSVAVTTGTGTGARTSRSSTAVTAWAPVTTIATFTTATAILAVEVGEVLLLAAPGKLGSDSCFLTAAADDLDALRLGAPLFLGRGHRDNHRALELSLGFGAKDVAYLGLGWKQGGVDDPLGLTGPGGTPRPGAVTSFTCEFDVDTVRHRDANLPAGTSKGRMVTPAGRLDTSSGHGCNHHDDQRNGQYHQFPPAEPGAGPTIAKPGTVSAMGLTGLVVTGASGGGIVGHWRSVPGSSMSGTCGGSDARWQAPDNRRPDARSPAPRRVAG